MHVCTADFPIQSYSVMVKTDIKSINQTTSQEAQRIKATFLSYISPHKLFQECTTRTIIITGILSEHSWTRYKSVCVIVISWSSKVHEFLKNYDACSTDQLYTELKWWCYCIDIIT